ncbi:MAG: late competence development ComFB family protein [Treponema sp.]|jgi:competence protein ComFB|nr:late competence development ComFB family protein [Treponema sp.]
MDIHNANEEIVFSTVETVFFQIEKDGNQEKLCLCDQCRMDTVCYTLNRIEPHYILSNRGLILSEQDNTKRQQIEADVAVLVHKGVRLVNHNMRPNVPHNEAHVSDEIRNHPIFDIPSIVGRIFDGATFEPIVGIELALYCDGELVPMRNPNWQNPYTLTPKIPGSFSFWPAPVIAENPDFNHDFKYSIRINSPDYESFSHFFSITATSKFHTPQSYTLNRTFRLPDLYIFPPGEAEENG